MLTKNNKIKKRNLGLDVTIHRRGKTDGSTIFPIADVQIPKAPQMLRANPDWAIYNFPCEIILIQELGQTLNVLMVPNPEQKDF